MHTAAHDEKLYLCESKEQTKRFFLGKKHTLNVSAISELAATIDRGGTGLFPAKWIELAPWTGPGVRLWAVVWRG